MRRLLLVLIFLILCVGCNQNTNYKNNGKQNNVKVNIWPNLTENTPITKRTSVSSNKNCNGSEARKMNIAMKTELDSYPKTIDTLTVVITNKNGFKCNTGKGYNIDYYNGSTWGKIPLQFLVNDIMIILLPQESKEFKINLYPEQYQYKSGKYRIYKTVYSFGGKHNIYAQFNIK
jgi:hypothetical protein